jgi:hypothetical protein
MVSLVGACAIGIVGVTGIMGFVAYLVLHVLASVAVLFRMRSSPAL